MRPGFLKWWGNVHADLAAQCVPRSAHVCISRPTSSTSDFAPTPHLSFAPIPTCLIGVLPLKRSSSSTVPGVHPRSTKLHAIISVQEHKISECHNTSGAKWKLMWLRYVTHLGCVANPRPVALAAFVIGCATRSVLILATGLGFAKAALVIQCSSESSTRTKSKQLMMSSTEATSVTVVEVWMYVISRLGFKNYLSKTKTKTKTQQFQDQDQDQDLLIQDQDQDQDQDSAVSRPRPRPRLRCLRPRPRPRLKTYKTNTGSPWLGWTVTNKKSWQAENPAYQ